MSYRNRRESGEPSFARLCILAGTFFLMLIVMSFCQSAIACIDASDRTRMLISSACQGVMIFAVPALACAFATSAKPAAFLGIGKTPRCKAVLGVLIVFAIGLPALNQLIYWNQNLTFPESMSGLEESLRAMEQTAADTSETLLTTDSIGGLICGILIIGCLTGLCEEFFFRGALQTTLWRGSLSPAAAIWVTAVVFSTLHFQFFGFLPRVILGAFFGYLFVWTGSLWTSVFAHAFNNSLVVVTAWLIETGRCSEGIDSLGVSQNGIPWIALLSLLATISFFAFCRKYFFSSKRDDDKNLR